MDERSVECPRCGQRVQVPTSGDKVRCVECGQKFRFDVAPSDTADDPAQDLVLDLAERSPEDQPETNEVRCPRCAETVDVPTSGEKVRCPGCGQKFRFDVPPAKPADEPAGEPANEVECPHCGSRVRVPTTGEKVRCEKCGQKFRYDRPPEKPAKEGQEKPLLLVPDEAQAANDVTCPRCSEMVAVPTSGDKVRCPGCGQKFRYDRPAPPPVEEADELPSPRAPDADLPRLAPVEADAAATDAQAAELRELWPTLCQFVSQVYEEGAATEADRRLFRSQADRAGELAQRLLPAPDDESREAHQILTALLPESTLDEIVALSLEDFRHLRESLDGAQALLDRQLPKPEPLAPAEGARPTAAARKAAKPSRAVTILFASAALLTLVLGAAIAAFIIRDRRQTQAGRELSWAEILGLEPIETAGPSTRTRPDGNGPRPRTDAFAVINPATRHSPFPGPTTGNSVTPPPEFPPTPRPTPRTTSTVGVPTPRVRSRWKADADGWIALFNGVDIEGWAGDPETWYARDGVLYGVSMTGAGALTARDANWTDYSFAVEAKLGQKGTLVLHHGALAVLVTHNRARLGYPGEGWRTLDEVDKGATRKEWYRLELDVKGPQAELRVNGRSVLASSGHTPSAGAPVLEVHAGGVALRSVRARIHDTDPDYRAVVLGEGRVAVAPPGHPDVAPDERVLSPGTHTLFNGVNLTGWTRAGQWTVRGGKLVARAGLGDVSILSAGSDQWTDYTFKARCTLTRKGRIVREGEYYLVIVRYQDDQNFFCVRFAIEGIYEIGYYRGGRWRETSRARHGLNSDFNKWRDIQITVSGNKLSLVIDGIGGRPPWTIPSRFRRGGVALAATGGEAAFDDVRIRLPR